MEVDSGAAIIATTVADGEVIMDIELGCGERME